MSASTFTYANAQAKLALLGQAELLQAWQTLTPQQQQELLHDIHQLDPATFQQQQNLLKIPIQSNSEGLSSFQDYASSGNVQDRARGQALIAEGHVGCILIAGGQGTRLGFDGPKGTYPISLIKKKTLFQLFAEKTAAASRQAERPLPLAIMTSPLNDAITRSYFKENRYFGLAPEQLYFFSQGMLPFLNDHGNLFLETPSAMAKGPDGNGLSLHHFWKSGIGLQWLDLGIRYLNYVLIDNPLSEPFDPELVGYHARTASSATLKCTPRRNSEEKVGVIVRQKDKPQVIEYTEIPEEERSALNADGTLKHLCANLSLFCFSMDFIETLSKKNLPLHKAYKKAKAGNTEIMSWKFEYFIFDILPFAAKINALLYPRETCFAPLKNAEGQDSPATVQAALLTSDRKTMEELTGHSAAGKQIEIAQDFYYPPPILKAKWRDRPIPDNAYIDP